MAGIGKVVSETLGTLSEEAAKATPKRTTYKAVKSAEVKKAQLVDKVEEIQEVQQPDQMLHKTEVLDSDVSTEFIGVRQDDITREQGHTAGAYKDTAAKIDVETNEEKLTRLREQRRDLYLKASDLKKERTATELIQSNKAQGRSALDTLYDSIGANAGSGNKHSNLEGRTTALYNKFNSGMTDLKETLRTKFAGLKQNTEMAQEVLRYLKDGKVKNRALEAEVKKMASQWEAAALSVKNTRNRSGGQVRDLEDWVIPQAHDKGRIRKAGFKTWKKTILTKLDVKRIESQQGADIETILTKAFESITAPEVETIAKSGGSKLAKRGEEARVLHFKTGDDIIDYNQEFGNPDIFSTMDNHIRQQSNEIAMLQMFGSNPEAMYKKLKELARADGSMGSIKEAKLDRLWRVSTGQVDGDDVVDKLDNFILQAGSGYRAIQIASKLGSATVSSLADLGNIVLGAGYRDLSSVKIMGRSLQTMFQELSTIGSASDNVLLANRIGVVSEFASASLANSRFAENAGTGFLQKAAETVIRSSGLGGYTTALRASFGLELAGNIADNLGKKLDDVPFASMLKEYGIDEAMWAKMGTVKKRKVKGAEFFDVTKMYGVDDELAYRVSEMVTNEMDAFVVMPGNRTRAWTTGGAKKGSAKGELARNLTLFKSFPISVVMMHTNRMAKLSNAGKVGYAGAAIGTNLIMGTITLMAYDLVTGKTPRSINRKEMVGEALAKSGGLGIFGDFFIGMKDTRYGSSFSDIIMGVPSSTINDVVKSAQDLMTKDGDVAVGNIYKRAKNYIPGQNLWYTRAVIERSIGDFLGEAIDPNHRKKLRRRNKAMRLRSQKLLFDN